jgi:hypothetical protein
LRGPLIALLVLTALLSVAPSAAAARRPCGLVPLRAVESVVVTSISAPCAEARRVARRWASKERCRDNRCRVKGWTCKPRGPASRCTRSGQAFELQRRFVIVD